ncbi:MAG: hypothetical protein AB7F67_16290 [Rhodospirillaceae bacterium]
MTESVIQDPVGFLAELGELHDVRIERIAYDSERLSLTLVVNDLNWGLEGFPEYDGPRPCAVVLDSVRVLAIDVEDTEGVRIASAVVVAQAGRFRLEIDLNLGGGDATGGQRSIAATFGQMRIRDLAPDPD